MARKFYSDDESNDFAAYEAEMAMDERELTDAEWEEMAYDSEICAEIDMERKAERALSFGYGS